MALETPKRVPITEQQWLRFFEELTLTTNTNSSEPGFVSSSVQASVHMIERRIKSVLVNLRLQPANPNPDRRTAQTIARVKEMRFLEAW